MRFADIRGNADVCRALAGMVDSGRVPHAILLHEDDGGGAVAIVQAFLQYLFCKDRHDSDSCGVCPLCNKIDKLIHPDVHYIFPVSGGTSSSFITGFRELVRTKPFFTEDLLYESLSLEGKSTLISVAESREVLDTLSLSPLEGGYKAVVIYLPEKMNKDSANRLLKSIEEPPEKTQFLLITHSPESVLPTILSRCQNIRIVPAKEEQASKASMESEYSELFASLMDALISRRLLEGLEVGERMASLPSRESAANFCRYASDRVRDMFLCQQDLKELALDGRSELWAASCRKTFPRRALTSLSKARRMVERNVNRKIVFTELVDTLFSSI